MTNDQLLEAIAQHGSTRKAAIALSISAESISKRFRKLPDSDPLKIRYNELTGKAGRPRIHADDKTRIRESVNRHRKKRSPQ